MTSTLNRNETESVYSTSKANQNLIRILKLLGKKNNQSGDRIETFLSNSDLQDIYREIKLAYKNNKFNADYFLDTAKLEVMCPHILSIITGIDSEILSNSMEATNSEYAELDGLTIRVCWMLIGIMTDLEEINPEEMWYGQGENQSLEDFIQDTATRLRNALNPSEL